MKNLEWLEEVKKEDNRYYSQEMTIKKYSNEYRATKALEIIAEELCYMREKPTVINNVNFPNK